MPWLIVYFVLLIAIAASSIWILKLRTLGTLLTAPATIEAIVGAFGFGTLAYYFSTTVGAPKLMRPSVPLATLLLR
jgi:hypothetical protein